MSRDLKTIREHQFTVKYKADINKTELFAGSYMCAEFSGEHEVEYCAQKFMETDDFYEAVQLQTDDPRFEYYSLGSVLSWIQSAKWSHAAEPHIEMEGE